MTGKTVKLKSIETIVDLLVCKNFILRVIYLYKIKKFPLLHTIERNGNDLYVEIKTKLYYIFGGKKIVPQHSSDKLRKIP